MAVKERAVVARKKILKTLFPGKKILIKDKQPELEPRHAAHFTGKLENDPSTDVEGSYDAFRKKRYFGSLNGLRALSVIAVIWHHAGPHYKTQLLYLFTNGAHGVTLFFAISGFLITTLLLREREHSGNINLKSFFIRRSLRILPLYYAVLAMYVVLVLAFERNSNVGQEFFNNLPFFLTYTSNWFVPLQDRVIFYFAWSLAAEEQFYLVWPIIQNFFKPGFALGIITAVIVIVTATQFLSAGGLTAEKDVLHRIVVGIPLAICFGVVLAHSLHHRQSYQVLRWAIAYRSCSIVWLGIFLGSLSWPAAPTVLIHSAAVIFVASCVCREDHWLSPILRTRLLTHVGVVSYGVYLLHMIAKNSVIRLCEIAGISLPGEILFVLTTLASVGLATLSFRYYEAIFLRIKTRYETN